MFWTLIQNEDDESKAFSGIMLNQATLNWSIRNSPIKIYNASDLKWMQELYDFIEETLCEVLQSKNYCCIGTMAWRASYRHAKVFSFFDAKMLSFSEKLRYSKFGIIPQGSSEPMDQEEMHESWISSAVYFSAPLWRYQLWTECFRNAFNLENRCLEDDLQGLFSLLFRPSSRQTKQKIENISRKYQSVRATIGKTEFNLFELMLALGAIYNPAHFRSENTSADKLDDEFDEEDDEEEDDDDEEDDDVVVELEWAAVNKLVHKLECELGDESKDELKYELKGELKDAIALLTKFVNAYGNDTDGDNGIFRNETA